jgi:hypothetical protein
MVGDKTELRSSSAVTVTCPLLHMSTEEPEQYLAILKASYDYTPQSGDEIAIKEDQQLLLVEKVDEEYVLLVLCKLVASFRPAGGKSRSRAMGTKRSIR